MLVSCWEKVMFSRMAPLPSIFPGDEGRAFADPPPRATNVPEYLAKRLWWAGQEGRVKGPPQVQNRKMAPAYGPRL